MSAYGLDSGTLGAVERLLSGLSPSPSQPVTSGSGWHFVCRCPDETLQPRYVAGPSGRSVGVSIHEPPMFLGT